MNYHRLYNLIISSPKSKKDKGDELHHIVPKHMGGTDDESNLVLLSFKAHYIAHYLLYKMYGSQTDKTVYRLMRGFEPCEKTAIRRLGALNRYAKYGVPFFHSVEARKKSTMTKMLNGSLAQAGSLGGKAGQKKLKKLGKAFYNSDTQRENGYRSVRKVISLDDGKVTIWNRKSRYNKKTNFEHTWIEL